MIAGRSFIHGLLALALTTSAARAGEVCVVCSDPPASYRCQLEGVDAGAPVTPGTQVLCITQMATRGGHRSCSVSRDQAEGACNGPLLTVAKPDLGIFKPTPKPSEPPAQISGAPALPPAATQGADGNAPPATMEALAKQAAQQTSTGLENTTKAAGEGVKKAGDTVGTAVKKTWNCLSSLFTAC